MTRKRKNCFLSPLKVQCFLFILLFSSSLKASSSSQEVLTASDASEQYSPQTVSSASTFFDEPHSSRKHEVCFLDKTHRSTKKPLKTESVYSKSWSFLVDVPDEHSVLGSSKLKPDSRSLKRSWTNAFPVSKSCSSLADLNLPLSCSFGSQPSDPSEESPMIKRQRQNTACKESLDTEETPSSTPSSSQSSQSIPTPPTLPSLTPLLDNYDLYLFDVVGVVHDGQQAFPNVIEGLNRLFQTKKVALVSNTPRPSHCVREKLLEMGLEPQIPLFTAGDLIRQDLQTMYQGQKVYHLGATVNQEILSGLDVKTTDSLEDADLVLLTQHVEEEAFLKTFDPLLEDIARRQLPVLCANADKTATVGSRLRYCAGSLAARFETMGGQVHYYGKPHPEIFQKILQQLAPLQDIPKERVLFVGDTLEKDILGADRCGFGSVLVLTGITAQKMNASNLEETHALKRQIKIENIRPAFWMKTLSLNLK